MKEASEHTAGVTCARLGEILLSQGAVDHADLERAVGLQSSMNLRLGEILVRLGAATEEAIFTALSSQLGLEFEAPLAPETIDAALHIADDAKAILPLAGWRRFGWFPVSLDTTPTFVTSDPLNPAANEFLERRFGAYRSQLAAPGDMARLFEAAGDPPASNGPGPGRSTADTDLRRLAEQAPTIELVNTLFASAIRANASDIHVEPFEDKHQVRLRVDGTLRVWKTIDEDTFLPVVSRIKLLSNMDIAEKRKPQDGRQTIRIAGRDMDLRVSSLPGPHGESLVMRLLEKARKIPNFNDLGMSAAQAGELQKILGYQHGIAIVTGPTGSGKSTTLYRALAELNDGQRKIITIEDPIEYKLTGVNQTQVQPDIGYTFAGGLRSILRQDPDVVMVGEIRDPETARIAVQASLTGHLVLSTLHTNTALGAIARLLDLGVEPFLLASALRGVLAQRLLRRLCQTCAPGAETRDAAQPAGTQGQASPGCDACGFTGYSGRVAVYEIAHVNEALGTAIAARKTEAELRAIALNAGFQGMRDSAERYVESGQTDRLEVERVLGRSGHG